MQFIDLTAQQSRIMALMAYDIGMGDKIFSSPLTFIATAEVISLLGAIPN